MTIHSQIKLEADTAGDEQDWALGPGSVTWKMLRDPVVYMLGQMRNSALLLMHPPFAASAEHDTFTIDPVLRFRRVGMYAYSVTFGTKADAERLSHMVRTRHNQVVGTEPITRRPYQSHSEYELALTHVIQASSYLAIYEVIYGELPTEERDQYYQEQKVPSAQIGVNPDYLPNTYEEAELFLAQARKRFAVGERGRELLAAYDNSPYPAGTYMGDLPYFKRNLALYAMRVVIDMAIETIHDDDRLILAINRQPKLRSRWAVRASLKFFSKFMRSKKGQVYWAEYLQKRAFDIFTTALEAEDAPGYEQRKKAFRVPDAKQFYHELPDLKRNWPGDVADYAVGREVEGDVTLDETPAVNQRDPHKHLQQDAA